MFNSNFKVIAFWKIFDSILEKFNFDKQDCMSLNDCVETEQLLSVLNEYVSDDFTILEYALLLYASKQIYFCCNSEIAGDKPVVWFDKFSLLKNSFVKNLKFFFY